MTNHQKKAMQDPDDVYDNPQSVLNDNRLTTKEKKKILQNWADEMQHILESRAENMFCGESAAHEEKRLQQVTNALTALSRQE